jgi:hypothetical protein
MFYVIKISCATHKTKTLTTIPKVLVFASSSCSKVFDSLELLKSRERDEKKSTFVISVVQSDKKRKRERKRREMRERRL